MKLSTSTIDRTIDRVLTAREKRNFMANYLKLALEDNLDHYGIAKMSDVMIKEIIKVLEA